MICGDTKPLNDPAGLLVYEDPCQLTKNMAAAWAHEIYTIRKQRLLDDFERAYRAQCLAVQSTESFIVEYDNKEYHYTFTTMI